MNICSQFTPVNYPTLKLKKTIIQFIIYLPALYGKKAVKALKAVEAVEAALVTDITTSTAFYRLHALTSEALTKKG
jgi:hypothetical protein